MSQNCGSFSSGSVGPLPYVKLSGTNPEIGIRRVNIAFTRLLVKPLSTGPLIGSYENPCL